MESIIKLFCKKYMAFVIVLVSTETLAKSIDLGNIEIHGNDKHPLNFVLTSKEKLPKSFKIHIQNEFKQYEKSLLNDSNEEHNDEN